jgi:hypothetical protein
MAWGSLGAEDPFGISGGNPTRGPPDRKHRFVVQWGLGKGG